MLRRRPFGVALFWLVFAVTIPWSLWEVGFDGWALMPRLAYLAVAACALLLLDFAPAPALRDAADALASGGCRRNLFSVARPRSPSRSGRGAFAVIRSRW